MSLHVTMGLLFYPRGGSAQVVRYLRAALAVHGWSSELVCGSLGAAGDRTDAATFFDDAEVRGLDYSPALAAFERGEDPIAHDPPMHPSYEDRPGVPDRVFAAVAPPLAAHLVDAWERFLREGFSGDPGVLHVHHLSPLQEAFARVAPGAPLVTHLHGTDMKMIDRVDRLVAIAEVFGTDLGGMADRALADALPAIEEYPDSTRPLVCETRWEQWRHGEHWAGRMRAVARASDRLIVVSPHDRDEAERLLGVETDRVTCIPNGVDTAAFDRRTVPAAERAAHWRRWLVTEPQGWDETGVPGSIRSTESEIEPLLDASATVLLFVGRFLDFKRVPLLVRAYAAARSAFDHPAPLVVWGGFPGEWEGEHPHTVAASLGVPDVFFVGWRGHDELALGLQCCDVMVAPSKDEPFGQVYLEAMSCGVPVIATRSGGPLSFVNTEPGAPNGWLIDVDREESLAAVMVEAVNDPDARRTRAANAYEQIRSQYAWDSLAQRFITVYEQAVGDAVRRTM